MEETFGVLCRDRKRQGQREGEEERRMKERGKRVRNIEKVRGMRPEGDGGDEEREEKERLEI